MLINISKKILANKYEILLVGIYLIIGFYILQYYQFSQRADIVPYLSISQKYISGNIKDAINGIWSPLISWLLIPFLLMDIPVLGFKILQIIIGIFALLILFKFLEIILHSKKKDILLLLVLTLPILYYYIFFFCSPDLLLSVILLYYIFYLSKTDYLVDKNYGIICGFFASLAFYAKAFALPFFLIHFLMVNFFYYKKNKENRKVIIGNYVRGVIIFVLLSGVWIVLLSLKYGYFTYSTSATYNLNVVGPEYNTTQPFSRGELYTPTNESAICYWEDPTFLPLKSWDPFSSKENFFHLAKIILKNIVVAGYFTILFSPMLVPLLLILIIKFKNGIKLKSFVVIVITIVVYFSGYLIYFITDRYIILPHLLIITITFVLIMNLFDRNKLSPLIRVIIILIFFISTSARNIYSITKYANEGQDLDFIVQELKSNSINGKFASVSSVVTAEDWLNTMFIAYMTKSKFYGEIRNDLDEDIIYNKLRSYKINYFFDWRNNHIISHPKISKIGEYKIISKNINLGILDRLIDNIYSFLKSDREYHKGRKLTIYKVIL